MDTGKGRTARDRESGPDRSGVFYTQKSLRRHEQRDTAVGKYKASVAQPKSGRALNLEREDNCRTFTGKHKIFLPHHDLAQVYPRGRSPRRLLTVWGLS